MHMCPSVRPGWLVFRSWLLVATAGLAVACAPSAPRSSPDTAGAAPSVAPTFENRVWRVAESTAVAPGQLYVFLADGTLVITSATGTPAFGQWKRDGAGLIMVEEGRPYRVEVLALTDETFSIRSHNPGPPVDIRFVRADGGTAAPGATR